MTNQDIIAAVEEVFEICLKLDRNALWNAIVPTEESFSQADKKSVTYVPSFEFNELQEFLAFIDEEVRTHSLLQKNKVRLMLTAYCRIMESDLPFTIIWNLLRAANGDPASWTFTTNTKSGVTVVCEYPRQKIDEIYRLSNKLSFKIGDVLNEMWDPYLRNSVSHSQYFLTERYFIPSGGLSPISRKLTDGVMTKGRSTTIYQIERLYQLARAFVIHIGRKWREACEMLN